MIGTPLNNVKSIVENNKVTKANKLIQKTKFVLNLTEQKLLAYLFSFIEPHDTELKEITIDIRDFCRVSNIKESENLTEVKRIISNLASKDFEMPMENKVDKTYRWLDSVIIQRNSSLCKIKLNSLLSSYLLNLKGNFTTFYLNNIMKFKSKHTIRLFEYLYSYKNIGSVKLSVNDFRTIMGLIDEYPNYRDLNKRVITPALNEINDSTNVDIEINLFVKRKNKAIDILDFSIKKKNKHMLIQEDSSTLSCVMKRPVVHLKELEVKEPKEVSSQITVDQQAVSSETGYNLKIRTQKEEKKNEINKSDTKDYNEVHLKEIMTKIIQELQNNRMSFANNFHISDKQIQNYFYHAIDIAKEEVCIKCPWIANWILKDKELMKKIREALIRGVNIKILYGIKSGSKIVNDSRDSASDMNAKELENEFKNIKTGKFIIHKTNSHYKVFICDEKFYVESSMNILSNKGDYGEGFPWHEGGQYSEDRLYLLDLKDRYFSNIENRSTDQTA